MRTTLLVVVLVVFSSVSIAQSSDVPLTNWTVPPYQSSGTEGITTMTDATPPRAFIGMQPCRVADTRGNAAPIQGGIFTNGQVRTWDLTGICGLPAGADAISANFTVTGSTAAPPGAFLLAWPTGGPTPPVSILNFQAGQTLANAAIVPLGAGEQINVNVSHSTHVILDVNGYFSDTLGNASNIFQVVNSGARAIIGETTSSAYLSIGVLGQALSTAGNVVGVWGSSASAEDFSTGTVGYATSVSGRVYGVQGLINGTWPNAAGVYGKDGSGDPSPANYFLSPAGVRGASGNFYGVLGISRGFYAVAGRHLDNSGNEDTSGMLGYDSTTGVFAVGQIGATGAKPFIDPHPSDPTKEIAFVALEGPEAGTYFRGKGRFQRGMAVISVPESFRMVTDSEDLSVQITPVGDMATVAVVSLDLDRIVVKASRDVEFFYTVNGVRKAFKDWKVITENRHYLPEGPEAKMPGAYVPEQRRRLIATGIYKKDGTVNMETARRLGWDKEWEKR